MRLRLWIAGCLVMCTAGLNAQEALAAPELREAQKPLPNPSSLLERAKAGSDAMMELRKSYTYKQVVVADDLDSHGNKKGTHTDEWQVFYVDKTEVGQHVLHDGKPLTDAERKKDKERVDKEIADIKAGKHKRPGMTLRASTLIKLATFGPPRREMHDGRPTIIFDYMGNPQAKADGIPEQVMKKLAGTIEVDETEGAIVRMSGTLQDNFHVLGGLAANIRKGSRFEMEAVRINDEVWFPKIFTGHVDGRILLFKGFDGDARVTFSDYRKMRASVTLLPGSQVIGEDGKPVTEPEAPHP